MAKPTNIKGKLDEVDKMWNMAFDDYEDSHDDDKESFVCDESGHGDLGLALKLHLMANKSKLDASKVLSKLGYSKPMTLTITMPSLVGTINPKLAHDLNVMPTNFMTSQLPNQLFGMTTNSMPNNLRDICFSLQGGLIGFPIMNNVGQWALLQQMQAMQTLVSLVVSNLGQHGIDSSQMPIGQIMVAKVSTLL